MVQTWNKARRGGNDVLDGGAGSDMAVFFGAVQHMGIKLRASTAADAAPGQQEVVLRHNLSAEEDILRGVEWLQVGGAGVPAGAAGSGCGGCVPGAGGLCAAGRRSGAGAGGAARVLRRSGRYKPDQLARAGAVTCPGCRGIRPRPVPGDCTAHE